MLSEHAIPDSYNCSREQKLPSCLFAHLFLMLVAYLLPPDIGSLLPHARRQILLITARDCDVIVTTQGLVWRLAAWKNKHELTYLSLAVTCVVVLGCEMRLCGDCLSKDIIHFFLNFQTMSCLFYILMCMLLWMWLKQSDSCFLVFPA